MPDTGRVVVADEDLELVGFAELLAVVLLEFLRVFLRVVAGGFLDVDGGLSDGYGFACCGFFPMVMLTR